MFAEKIEALKERDTIKEQNAQLVVVVAKACRTVQEFHIPEEVQLEAKIQKLAASVRNAKVEVAKIQFECNMKIT